MNDPLKNVEEDDNKLQNKDKFYYVISYVPVIQLIFVFSDIHKSNQLKKHMNQWITLFITYLIAMLVLWIFLPYSITKIVWMAYFLLALYLWANAYNGKYIHIPMVDELSEIFRWLTWWSSSSDKDKDNKKEEF